MGWMIDNPLFRVIGKILEVIGVSILWLILCIPIVTAGASTTALYYTVNKTIKNGRGYAIRGFFSAFISNFKQSTIVWLFFLVWLAILGVDCYYMYSFAVFGEKMGKWRIAVYVLTVLVIAWTLYVFPFIARFKTSTKDVFKNTFFMAVANAPMTIVLTGLFAAYCYAIYRWTPLIIVLPALYNVLKSIYIEKIFRKYMTEEQLQHEQELNGVVYDDSKEYGLLAKLKKNKKESDSN